MHLHYFLWFVFTLHFSCVGVCCRLLGGVSLRIPISKSRLRGHSVDVEVVLCYEVRNRFRAGSDILQFSRSFANSRFRLYFMLGGWVTYPSLYLSNFQTFPTFQTNVSDLRYLSNFPIMVFSELER